MDFQQMPPVLVGQKVLWSGKYSTKPEVGVVRWIGNIPEISSDWLVGIELDKAQPRLAGDGFWKGRKLFECPANHGLLVPVTEIEKFFTDKYYKPLSAENDPHFKLDDTQLEDFTRFDLPYKEYKKNQTKTQHSYAESKAFNKFYNRYSVNSKLDLKEEDRDSKNVCKEEFNSKINVNQHEFGKKVHDAKYLGRNIKYLSRNFDESGKNSLREYNFLNPEIDLKIINTVENSQIFHSKNYLNEITKNMNEIAGYFKEIKEGDERFEKQKKTENISLYDTNESGSSKPKKLFSFLKWFNKKHKNEPNLKLFKESSAASSPTFPRKETSSCESIDTLFSTQTVRSFAYIPPTQYIPSAPPLDNEKSSYENVFDDLQDVNKLEETESIYDRRKKRKAPEPPRLSRESSLPTTLEHKTFNGDFEEVKTCHRRTLSESFKDKKAGAYCHVQGKKKAPPPPPASLYPNLQKRNNQYQSLHKKKKPAPPPPDCNFENPNKLIVDIQKEKRVNLKTDETKKETPKAIKNSENEEKEMKMNQMPKSKSTKDPSLSPLPSRPWYKRSHRDSTGSSIIRKDLLKGFDKKKNKESNDWMPEVGLPRRRLSTETSHSKFNIFSKLEKTDEKKKEEKRKSQISILTNISELDREAAEILKKEQAEEKKMMAANDEKYYVLKKSYETIYEFNDKKPAVTAGNSENESKSFIDEKHSKNNKAEGNLNSQKDEKFNQSQAVIDQGGLMNVKPKKDRGEKDEKLLTEEKLKEKDNNSEIKLNVNQKENKFSLNAPTDLTNSSSQTPHSKISKINDDASQSRLNYFNVQNKELKYLNEPWVCLKCTLENPGWRVFCEICSSIKPTFSFNDPAKKIQPHLEKEPKESESVLKTEELNLKTLKQHQTTTTTEEKNEPEAATSAESPNQLRKKRINYFSTKLLTSSGSDNNESEPEKFLVDPNKSSSAKISNELKDSVPDNNLIEENNDERNLVKNFKKETSIEKKKIAKGNVIISSISEEGKEKKEYDESHSSNEAPEKQLEILRNDPSNNLKNKIAQSSRAPSDESQQIAEAYIITKTVVLEDIIIKKPERGKKVSSSSQTKSSIFTSPEIKAVRPPPRTKKIAFENTTQPEKEVKPDRNSKNNPQQIRDYNQKDLEELTQRLTQAEGLADFRANIETMPLNTEMNTVAVNRLLRKLETAINCGDHFIAAGLAKELALLKINCSVTRQVASPPKISNINIDLYIEDKTSQQGPIPLEVSPAMSLLQLKKKVQQELNIPIEVQRWILGKKLATDDNKTLEAEGVNSNYSTLFLYLVAPDDRNTSKEASVKSQIKSELKLQKDSQPNLNDSFDLKTKGWYYNHEEDHYSHCEDSEDSESNGSRKNMNVMGKTEKIISEGNRTAMKISESITDKMEAKAGVSEEDISLVFDLKSGEIQNDIEKELKFIPVNSVKQKVEKLNKTFAENVRPVKPLLRSSRSPETWKCTACDFVNVPAKFNCTSCNAKKVITGPNSRKIIDQEPLKKAKENSTEQDNVHYKALIELQDADLVPNSEPFNCSICLVDYAPGEGVILKDCLHTFCRACLVGTVQFSEDAEIKCPYLDDTYSCPSVLQQREIKALVPQKIFELHLAKSVKEAENKTENAFHCKTPDCKGWCIYEDNVNEFRCPVCKITNCLTCQAIHTGINCREYQERMKDASETDVDAKKTRDMLNEMVEKGEALPCPKCQVVLMKKWGCDWLKCSMCKTEICWVTRGFRWGPEGKGDTSAGCKCGVNGVKCHPKCNYCH